MNYDAQQYAFSHGLATAPQLNLQQQQLHQQQQQQHFKQQIFQQYSQAVPTSNVYQFHFAGGGSPINSIFQQKEAHQMGIPGNMQSRMVPHSMAQQPFIKQGVHMGIDGNAVHVVGSLNGMVYSEQKNNMNIVANPEGRMIQQSEGSVRMQPTLVGMDMMSGSGYMEQSFDSQLQQHQGIRVAGQGNMFTYNKQQFSGWMQPQTINQQGSAQHTSGCQSTLPSFSHVWSQFPHQKQDVLQHQQYINQYQQPQQLQQQQQQQMHAQQHFTNPSFQALPGIQVIKMQQQKQQQISLPVSMGSVSPHPSQKMNCFSPSQSNLVSTEFKDRKLPSVDMGMQCVERGVNVSSQAMHSSPGTQSLASCGDHEPSTAVTYTESGPPKVTVTLDSLTQRDTFSPNQFPGRLNASFKTDTTAANIAKGNAFGTISNSSTDESCTLQPQQDWQLPHQRNIFPPKSCLHSSSAGSSFDRPSSGSSNFSSPPYTFTPPSSMDSLFSPVHMQFPKTATESLLSSSSSGRTSQLSSSSSPPVAMYRSSWPESLAKSTTLPTITTISSVASSTCTTSTATVVFSCNTVAITTTSVTSTVPCPRESTSIASVHSNNPLNNANSCMPGPRRLSCSPARTPSTLVVGTETNMVKVPYSWIRKCENGVIIYISPSGAVLQSFEQICRYLLSDSTCKCGLECPIQVEKFFNFDPEVEGQPWTAGTSGENLGNLCNHRREIVALAAFHSSQVEAAVIPSDNCLELGKKRERKKSIGAGEGLIVAPLKRLKTSITNAVNRHAMSMGNSSSHNEKSQALNMDMPCHKTSASPVDSKGGYINNYPELLCHGIPQGNQIPGKVDCHRLQPSMDNAEKVHGNLQMQHCKVKDDNKQNVQHQMFHNQQGYNMGRHSHGFMPAEDNHLFHGGHGKEAVTGLSNNYPLEMGFPGGCHQMQYQSSQLSHHHHNQQQGNPGLFFPQSHVYPNMPQLTHLQGYHPGLWQDGNSSGPAAMPHSHHHHHTRQYPPNINFQHSNFNHPQPGMFPKHSTTNPQVFPNQPLIDPKKNKSKRPKSKKDKHPHINSIVDRSSPCSKSFTKPTKTAPTPTTTASFFGNPIVFVEQQAAMINNSIASCHLACPTPSPPQSENLKPPVTFQPLKDTASEKAPIVSRGDTEHISNKDLYKNAVSDKDDEEDQKTGTDLDSNKSFSDTTENNDSAYLSQTGSDQERSDTIDGLDSCSDVISKSTPSYYFNPSEEQEKKGDVELDQANKKSSEQETTCVVDPPAPKISQNNPVPQQEVTTASSKVSSSFTKIQDKKTVKARQRVTQIKKNVKDTDVLKKGQAAGSLNGDLSQLLASNNWNIPALQQVLAQHSRGDPGKLNAAVQHVWSQISGSGTDFPASNLLSAAARAQLNQRQEKVPVSQGKNIQVPQNVQLPATDGNSPRPSVGDSKSVSVSTSLCGTIVTSVSTPQQPQASFQQIRKGTDLITNMMHLQQLPTGNFAMNMVLPANGQGHTFASDSFHTGTFNSDADLKSGQRTVNPLVAQGILTTVSKTGDIGPQIKLPLASVIPSSLGPSVAQCHQDGSTVLLNSFGPRMIMNAPMPPVSVSVVTNVTKSLTQVVPAISINQTVFGTHQVTQQLLGTQQSCPQIISAGASAGGAHIINTSPQLVTTAPQGAQFVNPTPPNTQLVGNTAHTTQFVNTLSVQGLNNQLLIANPIQQVSPSNSLSQLSPAMAAQILAHGHQQLPQMSPSFLPNQLHKQNPVINSQSIFASVSLPTATGHSVGTDVIASSISQSSIISSNVQKNALTADSLVKVDCGNSMSQVKDTNVSLSNTPVYATPSQPVFVIPQATNNTVVQMLGSAQPLTATSGLPADLNLQQGSLSQIFGQSATVDQTQFQNLLTGGFTPLMMQQMLNTVNLGGVQQQQLQLLQLQQLMLQAQGHNIQSISLPLNQNPSVSQATALATPAIVNTIIPQQGLQLGSVMDMNSLHPCLSPVAQGFQSNLTPTAAHLQHISSALSVTQMAPINTCATVSVVQNGNVQNIVQASPKQLQPGLTLQPQTIFSELVSQSNHNSTANPPVVSSQEPQKNAPAKDLHPTSGIQKSQVTSNNVVKLGQQNKPKSKSKSKKSESKKVVDPETERNEEDIAATVQQILAQAVQQQKELSLAAKNQPPPPPKSKSKKSQARSKASQALKEHDLGKLASISDDAAVLKSEDTRQKDKPACEVPIDCSSLVESSGHFSLVATAAAQSSHSDTRQSQTMPQPNHIIFTSPVTAPPQTPHHFPNISISTPSFTEQTLTDISFVNTSPKKSSISLKDHLSSIVSKDGFSKKVSNEDLHKQGRSRTGIDTKASPTIQPVPVISSDVTFHSKTQRKSIK